MHLRDFDRKKKELEGRIAASEAETAHLRDLLDALIKTRALFADDTAEPGVQRRQGEVTELVREAVARMLAGDFQPGHIVGAIKTLHPERTDITKSSVSWRLGKLAESGEIELVKQGEGRAPSIYRCKQGSAGNKEGQGVPPIIAA